jgi:hypothetical protein
MQDAGGYIANFRKERGLGLLAKAAAQPPRVRANDKNSNHLGQCRFTRRVILQML